MKDAFENDNKKFAGILKTIGGIVIFFIALGLMFGAWQSFTSIATNDLKLLAVGYFMLWIARFLFNELRWW